VSCSALLPSGSFRSLGIDMWVAVAGPGDGVTNMLATFLVAGCTVGSGVAVFSLMGNGKKIEG
jgi:hypothetical protein